MKKIKYFIFSLLIMFIGIFDVYGFSGFSDTQKNALKKFLKSFEYPSRLLGSCRYSHEFENGDLNFLDFYRSGIERYNELYDMCSNKEKCEIIKEEKISIDENNFLPLRLYFGSSKKYYYNLNDYLNNYAKGNNYTAGTVTSNISQNYIVENEVCTRNDIYLIGKIENGKIDMIFSDKNLCTSDSGSKCINVKYSYSSTTSMAERPNSDISIDLLGCIIDEGTQSIIDWIMNLVRIGGVILLVVLGMLDFVKAAASGEQEEMKKSKSKFVKRLIACVVLFFIPIIVDILVGLVNLGSGENCNSNDSNDKTDDSNNRVSYQCSCKYYRSNVDEPNISDVSLSFDVTNKDNFDSHTINYNGKNVTVKINSPQKNATSSTDMLCPKKCSFDESKKVLTCSSKDNDETFQNNNPHFYQAADENGKLLENCKILSN